MEFKNKTILVTGGAGYIGSHVVRQLGETGANIIVVDNLSTGHKKAVLSGTLQVGDIGDRPFMESIISTHTIDAIVHFAGSVVVPESISDPLKYYDNNTRNSFQLLELCTQFNIPHFVFSSTAAVYGIPKSGVCTESSPLNPINPYGRSKLMTEWMLEDTSHAMPLNYVALRYFNVAGADLQGRIGQATPNATHLIKLACETACGKKDKLLIFGTDYDTKDGTCIRDYIHVEDLAHAHILALDYLFKRNPSQIFNCGYSQGYTVKEVIDTVKSITRININTKETSRREGDPPELIANSNHIQETLGWVPQYNNLETIIESAYQFEKSL